MRLKAGKWAGGTRVPRPTQVGSSRRHEGEKRETFGGKMGIHGKNNYIILTVNFVFLGVLTPSQICLHVFCAATKTQESAAPKLGKICLKVGLFLFSNISILLKYCIVYHRKNK